MRKHCRWRFGVALGILSALAPAWAAALAETEGSEDRTGPACRDGVQVVATAELAPTLSAGGEELRVTGRMSLNLVASQESLARGRVNVAGFNVALFSVPQARIAGEAGIAPEEGVLGFAILSGKRQSLRYDPETGTLSGEIDGYIDAAYMPKLVVPSQRMIQAPGGRLDLIETPTQPATIRVEFALRGPLEATAEGVRKVTAEARWTITAREYVYEGRKMPAFEIAVKAKPAIIDFEIGHWWFIEAARRLCVQPIRIIRFEVKFTKWGLGFPMFSFSGAGLAFGQPGARDEWAKADLVFTYRDWKSIWDSRYWVTSSDETSDLLDEVDDDDCIEATFVYAFDPEGMYGGGATWGGGTAGSKIITSDGNARGGVDFTHLAHELGHVVGLHHPGAAATSSLTPASTGTLLCPSGYLNDNPAVNSQENKDNLQNPLLTFALKYRTAGPDCTDSTDCGACP